MRSPPRAVRRVFAFAPLLGWLAVLAVGPQQLGCLSADTPVAAQAAQEGAVDAQIGQDGSATDGSANDGTAGDATTAGDGGSSADGSDSAVSDGSAPACSPPVSDAAAAPLPWSQIVARRPPNAVWALLHPTTDEAGNLYVIGISDAPASLDGAPLPAGDFVAKIDPNGALAWVVPVATPDAGVTAFILETLAVSATGDVAIRGTADSPIAIGGTTVPAGSFVSRLDACGNVLWANHFAPPGLSVQTDYRAGSYLTFDPAGNVLFAGGFMVSNDFGGGPLYTPGGGGYHTEDIYVVKLDARGRYVGARAFGGTSIDMPTGLTTDATGAVVLTAYSESPTIDLGGGSVTLPSSPSAHLFVAKYSADLTQTLFANAYVTQGKNIVGNMLADPSVHPNGEVSVAGMFHNDIDVGGGPTQFNDFLTHGVLLHLAASGAYEWSQFSRYTGAIGGEVSRGTRLDAAGNIFLRTTNWSYAVPPSTPGDCYLMDAVVFDPSGTPLRCYKAGWVAANDAGIRSLGAEALPAGSDAVLYFAYFDGVLTLEDDAGTYASNDDAVVLFKAAR